jgi:uncharacterized membrane protein YGL010W
MIKAAEKYGYDNDYTTWESIRRVQAGLVGEVLATLGICRSGIAGEKSNGIALRVLTLHKVICILTQFLTHPSRKPGFCSCLVISYPYIAPLTALRIALMSAACIGFGCRYRCRLRPI